MQLCFLVDGSLYSCKRVLETPFYQFEPGWAREAAFTYLMIQMKDLLLTLDRLGGRVSFTDDVLSGGDITDLVREMRNAVAHNGSPLRHADKNQNGVAFGMVVGKGPFGRFHGEVLECPYEDDVAFFYGKLRILLRRQIWRAIDEASDAFNIIAPKFNWHPMNG